MDRAVPKRTQNIAGGSFRPGPVHSDPARVAAGRPANSHPAIGAICDSYLPLGCKREVSLFVTQSGRGFMLRSALRFIVALLLFAISWTATGAQSPAPVDTRALGEVRWRMIGPHRASRTKA